MRLPYLMMIFILLIPAIAAAELKAIDISLDYVQNDGRVIGFTVIATKISWLSYPYGHDKLCTIWSVEPKYSSSRSDHCYGSESCCSFLNLDSGSDYWDDDFFLTKGKYGAADSNTVAARVYYFGANEPGNGYYEIIDSNRASLPADFGNIQENKIALNSAQNKQVILTLYPGVNSPLNILQHSPADNSYYGSLDNIDIKYFVDYQYGQSVNCSLLFNDAALLQIPNFPQATLISAALSLDEGKYKFRLSCKDTQNNTKASSERTLILDYSQPSITLNTESNYLTFMDYVSLNFTPKDNLAEAFGCILFLNNNEYQSINVESDKMQRVLLSNLANGSYEWKIKCADLAGNQNTSEARKFNIDTNHEFGLALNQDKFNIGQKGYYIITAPYKADTTLLITDPKGATYFRYYHDEVYPIVGEINFTEFPGIGSIEAILTYNNGLKKITKEFEVKNTFTASISLDKSDASVNAEISFEGFASGGIGAKTYEWDFGDDAKSAEKTPKHSYNKIGTYNVKLTATDSAGNTASAQKTVYIRDTRALEIIVKNQLNEPLHYAQVFVDGEKKETDEEGKVSFTVLEGFRKVIIINKGYFPFSEDLEVSHDTSKTYYLDYVAALNISSLNITDEEIQQVIGKENAEETPPAEEIDISINEKIDRLTNELTSALYDLNNMDKLCLDAAEDLLIEENLQEAKKNLLRAKRDLEGLKFIKDTEERKQREVDIKKSVGEVQERTITGIDVKKSEEYSTYPESKETEELLKRYATLSRIPQKDEKDFIKINEKLQSSLLLIKSVKNAELTFLSGKTQQITLIKGEYQIKEDKNNILILESIPKNLAKSSDEIEFVSAHQILESDPIIVYDPSKIEKIVYYFRKEIDPEDTKKIVSVIVNPLAKSEAGGGFSLTGLAVFSSLSGIEDPLLFVQIALIVILLIIYILYEFEILVKIKKYDVLHKLNPLTYLTGFTNKDMRELNSLIKKAEKEIRSEELKKAEGTYHDLIKIYNDRLGSELRKKAIDRISFIYNELLVHRILKKAKEIEKLSQEKEKKKAREAYNNMQELYIQLPKSWKTRVSSECHRAFGMLSAK